MMKTLFFVQTMFLTFLPSYLMNFNIHPGAFADWTKVEDNCTPALSPRYFGRHAEWMFPRTSADNLQEAMEKAARFRKNPYQLKKIIIDPGHGGYDPGTSGRHSKEKNLALGISLKVAELLRQQFPDMEVLMTRNNDTFIPLHERASTANKQDADLFISIHCNYSPAGSWVTGTETYVLGQHRMQDNMDVAMRENAAILFEDNYEENYGYDPNSPEGHIMLSMFQNAYLEHSIAFAHKVETKMKKETLRKSRGVKQAGFLVLRETAMPSVLIETGYLSNSTEEKYLMTEEGQLQVAMAVVSAFRDYKKELELGQLTFESEDSTEVVNTPVPQAATNPPPRTLPTPTPAKETPAPTPAEPTSNSIPLIKAPGNQTTASGVQFRVQLAASPGPLDTNRPPWAGLVYPFHRIQEDNYYKYQAVGFDDLEAALRAQQHLRHQGFKDAFVVAYHNGERISVEEAKRLAP